MQENIELDRTQIECSELLGDEYLAQENAEQNMDIGRNLRSLYCILAAEILNLEHDDSLLEYLIFINSKDNVKSLISSILNSAADIAYQIKGLATRKQFLPQVFYDEKWRVMRLIVDIIVDKPKTKKAIEKLIYCCEIEDQRYL